MFTPGERHCTTCHTVDPETDEDGETTCCLDTVCEADETGRCDRCNPLCGLCGFEISDGWELDARNRQIHSEGRCTEALDKASPAVKKTRKTPQRKLAESAGIVSESTPESAAKRGTHAACEHPATKAARAACRRKRSA